MRVQTKIQLPFMTLLLMISFASVNAVLFTPALPAIANYFTISNDLAGYTITWFLVGYAFGQLFYGPLANRFGRKPALYAGISLQIISSFICAFSGLVHVYAVLVLGRFLLALGSGVGLKMVFT
jgi:DHA1 family bicyclomycin/chloramphenicol resistance-like MFS transporter